MWNWLEWSGWDGISGLVALLALAVAAAVTFIELRAWYLNPRHPQFSMEVSRDLSRTSADARIGTSVRMRISGPSVIYDMNVYRDGGDEGAVLLLDRPVLRAEDGFIEAETTSVAEHTARYEIVVTWMESTRLGPRSGGARLWWSNHDGGLERWRRYRWPFWPRKASGRWVPDSLKGPRQSKGFFVPPTYRH